MYSDRKAAEAQVTAKFEQFLNTIEDCKWQRTGVELNHNPDFCQRLIKMSTTNDLAKRLRYQPDYMVESSTRTFFFDCKSCKNPAENHRTIERQAYLHYMQLINEGQNVRLVVELPSRELASINPANLVFVTDPTFKNSWNVPIEEGIWRCPRKMPQEDYMRWKAQYPFGSGTECAYFSLKETPNKILK